MDDFIVNLFITLLDDKLIEYYVYILKFEQDIVDVFTKCLILSGKNFVI